MSLFSSYAAIFIPASYLGLFISRYLSLAFVYNDPGRFFHGSFYLALGFTSIAALIVLFIERKITKPFDDILLKIEKENYEPTEDDTVFCLNCYKKLNLVTLFATIFSYVVGQSLAIILGVMNGSHEYIFSRVVLLMFQNLSFAVMFYVLLSEALDFILMKYRRRLKIHFVEPYKKQKTLSTSMSFMVFSLAAAVFFGVYMVSAPYGFLMEIQLKYPEFANITDTLIKKCFTCFIIIAAICFIPLYILTKGLDNRVRENTKMVNDIAEKGDLRQRVNIGMIDDFGALTSSTNHLIDKLTSMIAGLKNNSDVLGNCATDIFSSIEVATASLKDMVKSFDSINENCSVQNNVISKTDKRILQLKEDTENIQKHVVEQTAAIEEISSSVSAITTNIKSVAVTAKNAEKVSEELSKTSEEGNKSLKLAIESMNEIQAASEEVQSIVHVLQKIASQTNLLSMNAAIEAAHAGEVGMGFAVVADEVRSLADSSSKSSKTIQEKIRDMNDKIIAGVNAMSSAEIAFGGISDKVVENASLSKTISNAMEEQRLGAEETLLATADVVNAIKSIKSLSEKETSGVLSVKEDMEAVINASCNTENAVRKGFELAKNLEVAISTVDEKSLSNKEVSEQVQTNISHFVI